MIVPFSAGTSDTVARLVGTEMSKALGQPVVVENRPGGAGTVGADAAAKAAPDGHTLLVGSLGPLAVNAWLFPSLPFDPRAFEKMIPTMPADMLEMWFGRTFNRDGLDAKTRLLVTVAALTVQGAHAEPQLRLTIRHAIEAGATAREVAEVIYQMGMFGGIPAMQKALEIAQGVFTEHEGKQAE